jgi:hypothetical protein
MATTTATLTLSSADLTSDALSLSTSTTFTKADTVTGLNQTSGVGRKTTSATTQYTLFTAANYTAAKAHKVYIKNTSNVATEYLTLHVAAVEVGRIYAGDWTLIPFTAASGSDLKLTPSVATELTVEYAIFIDA